MAEKNSRRNETTDALFDAILSLESREECYAFFEDLCTVKEISDMAQRLQAAKLLLIGERLPQALVCANDNMAIGAMRAFREAGVRIPEDVAVTGFDDTPLAELLGLTTVAIPNYERGYLAAQHLIANIEGAQSYETFKIQARVVWRASAGGGEARD